MLAVGGALMFGVSNCSRREKAEQEKARIQVDLTVALAEQETLKDKATASGLAAKTAEEIAEALNAAPRITSKPEDRARVVEVDGVKGLFLTPRLGADAAASLIRSGEKSNSISSLKDGLKKESDKLARSQQRVRTWRKVSAGTFVAGVVIGYFAAK